MSIEKQGADFEYQILTTADGSPSLRLWKDHQPPEAMHHLGGALSETMYIYDAAIQKSFELTGEVRVLSVGLGLGYNEILSAARAYGFGVPLVMESFESEAMLRNEFLNWLHDHHAAEPFKSTYDQILGLIAAELGVLPQQIKSTLIDAEASGHWILRGRLELDSAFEERFHCVLFDAFSSGSTPDLWTEEFLVNFLGKSASMTCVFSTYAATGSLKRSLAASGFAVEMRAGFANKRQSTWAIRAPQ